MKTIRTFWAIFALFIPYLPVYADEPKPPVLPKFTAKDMVPLPYGPNWIDLDGDGHKDLVMKSRFEIDSPHSFGIYTFHIYVPNEPTNPPHQLVFGGSNWYAVQFPDRGEPPLGNFDISTHQGGIAGCMIHDLRLLIVKHSRAPSGNGTYIVDALRDFGHSYGDDMPVTFTVYKLALEHPHALGEFAFIQVAQFQAKHNYCSVIDAFQKELGLPNHDPRGDAELIANGPSEGR